MSRSALFLILLSSLALLRCGGETPAAETQQAPPPLVEEKNRLSAARAEGAGAGFCTGPDGGIVAWWMEKNDSSQLWHMMAAKFDTSALSFLAPVRVAPAEELGFFPSNIPKLTIKKDGTWLALWAEKEHGAESAFREVMYYSQSKDEGKTWTNPRRLNENLQVNQTEEFADLITMANGEAAASWLLHEGDESVKGSRLMFAYTRTDGTFGPPKLLAENTCECCPTSLALAQNGTLWLMWRQLSNSAEGDDGAPEERNLLLMASSDHGKLFYPSAGGTGEHWPLNACPVSGGALQPVGNLFMQCAFYSGGMENQKEGPDGLWFTTLMRAGGYATHPSSTIKISPAGQHPVLIHLGDDSDENFSRCLLLWDETANGVKQVLALAPGNTTLTTPEQRKAFVVSDAGAQASYPAAVLLKKNVALVAWTQKSGNNWPGIYWKVVNAESVPAI